MPEGGVLAGLLPSWPLMPVMVMVLRTPATARGTFSLFAMPRSKWAVDLTEGEPGHQVALPRPPGFSDHNQEEKVRSSSDCVDPAH